MDELINRRIWDKEHGLSYFCSICGKYKPEKFFYRDKSSKWGVSYKCKIHSTRADKGDKENAHLKLQRVTRTDFEAARRLLQAIGYDTSKDIHEQFMTKHKLKIKSK